ncbi:MAG: hypothetical protein Q9187_001487 [Circinaria calcarea]
MEHLRDDYNDFTFPYKVHLLCDPSAPLLDRQERNLNDFVQLPQLLGWKIHENGDREFENGSLLIDEVMQRWLYFEVLAQVFGHLPGYQWDHFVIIDTSGQSYINTLQLPDYLERWLDSEKKSPTTERNRRLIRIQQVLDRARVYVSQHCTVPNLDSNARWEISDLLALSFMVLGETLTRALNLIRRKVGFSINGWCSHDSRNQGWGYSKIILQKLRADGWCAKALHMLQALLRGNTIGLVYLFTLRESSSKGGDHAKCTASECREKEFKRILGRPVDPVQYHHCSAEIKDFCFEEPTQYVGPGQTPKYPICTTVENFKGDIEGRALAAIIDKGKIPLFRFQKTRRSLELVEMSQSFDKSYAIFSHVWADGFANLNNKNEMSLCVLNMFSKILEQVAIQRAGTSSPVQELFWIDTLAIPVQGEFTAQRFKAISQMHNIYTHAKYTIVLDLSLMRVTMGSGYSNPAMKITMSKWMTRLWTLQEAVLSKNLFFYFQDHIYSMNNLEDMFAKEDSELHSCIPSLSRIYHDGILGQMRPKIHEEFRKDEGWKPRSDFLAAVWKATQWRSTSHLIHETLSLATMLNVNTELFAPPSIWPEKTEGYQQDCDERMISLLSLFAAISPCPIPPGMIFLPGPRLLKNGYGWAPRTWLSSREIDSPDPLSLPDAGNTRLTASEGLEVQFPGFLLHDLGDSRNELDMRENFFFSADSRLLDWYRVEPAEDPKRFPGAERLLGRDLAIIVSRLPVVDLREIALFVAIKRTWGGIHYVEIPNRVWISREERQEMLQEWSDKHRKGDPDAMSAGERLSPSEKWCVDGPTQPAVVPGEEKRKGDAQGKKEAQFSETNDLGNGRPNRVEAPEPNNWLVRKAKTLTWSTKPSTTSRWQRYKANKNVAVGDGGYP